jgi:hypothetical protein
VLFIDIIGMACLVAGFTATDTAKVSAERANPALRILPESSSQIISMSYTDFFSLASLLRVSFFNCYINLTRQKARVAVQSAAIGLQHFTSPC